MHEAAVPSPIASCPRCGAEAPPAASGCRACGFEFVDAERRRRPSRPRLAAFVIGGALAAVLLGVLLTAGKPASTGPARAAEKQVD